MGYCFDRLTEPVFIAVSKLLLTEFSIHHRLESFVWRQQLRHHILLERTHANMSFSKLFVITHSKFQKHSTKGVCKKVDLLLRLYLEFKSSWNKTVNISVLLIKFAYIWYIVAFYTLKIEGNMNKM